MAQLPRSKVVFTDNRSVLLSQQKNKQGVRVVRVHQMFLDAPTDVALATARFLVDGNRRDGRVVDAFIDAQAHLLALVARPFSPDAHRGRVHDLLPLYTHLNSKYFADRISAEMGWGQAPPAKRRARRSITFGSYDHRAKRIVMHPALDQPHVPSLVVARVLHHEMLHQLHGDERAPSGRRIVHGPRFRTDEARFDGAVAADAWLDRHLDGLLRYKAPGRLR